MSGLREVRDALLHSYAEQLINEEEFLLLYDLNKSKNPDYAYWNYEIIMYFTKQICLTIKTWR